MKLLVMVGEIGAIRFRSLVEKILSATVNHGVNARPSQSFLFPLYFMADTGNQVAHVNALVDAIQHVCFQPLQLRKP